MMAMGAIYHKCVHSTLDESGGTVAGVISHTHRCGNSEPSQLVLACVRISGDLLDILDGDQATQRHVRVNYWQFLDAVLVQDGLGFVQSGAFAHRHQVFTRHGFRHVFVQVGLKSQVAIGQDTYKLAIASYR